ncbi:MAG TPA: methionine--tRNA ligase [Thermomicrobiales bacterium]|nr:methionine--tRNA ligase [Thermomicrobiales bacterium]
MTGTTATPETSQRERVLVCVAWPYANGPFHVGHVSGVYLPADIFARFQRARGADVLMVSGSDCHGAPITIRAEREGVSPLEIVERYHASFLRTFNALGIEFDLFTKTYTENHYAVTQDFFLRLLERGYLYRDTMTGSYSPAQQRFLPDRYVEGTCPVCGFARARGDQCDNCGTLLDPEQLIEPRSVLDGSPVVFRETEHFFLDLGKLEPALRAWLDGTDRGYWRNNTVSFTRNWLREGLHGRAITRDLDWGVPVPLDDPAFKDKRIYVWFDAVIGYLSASIEWAQRRGTPDAWERWWRTDETATGDGRPSPRSYYFLGKDNIPFHTIIWPAMLIGYGGLDLPYDVPASEFMNLEGEQMSTSRNWAVWLPDVEDRYQPDALRYYLTAVAPETRDSNWSWGDFVTRIDSELVATYGNLVNRVLSFTYRNFDGRVPAPRPLGPADTALLAERDAAFARVTDLLADVHLRDALREALALAGAANRYLDERAPWKAIKTDRQAAATALYVAIQVLDALKTLTYPFLPFSAERLHAMLGFDPGDAATGTYSGLGRDGEIAVPATARWAIGEVPAGQPLRQPAPLFTKLDPAVADEELTRLQAART